MLFKRILVIVDGSPTSQYAVDASLTLSREDGSSLLFCVSVDPELCGAESGMVAFGEIAIGRSQQLLDDALARARAGGCSGATGVIVRDDPVRGAVAVANKNDVGLIVLGVAPRVGILRPFMQSLAHEILVKTTIPLCVMRRPAIGRLSHRILVPIVDDALSRHAIDYAITLAQDFKSTLLFCTLAESSAMRSVAQSLVENARAYAGERGVAGESFLLESRQNVSQTITRNAVVHGCDAIVMATHARAGFQRLVEGSVTEAVIYSSNVPVMMVRAPSS